MATFLDGIARVLEAVSGKKVDCLENAELKRIHYTFEVAGAKQQHALECKLRKLEALLPESPCLMIKSFSYYQSGDHLPAAASVEDANVFRVDVAMPVRMLEKEIPEPAIELAVQYMPSRKADRAAAEVEEELKRFTM